jgi:hypothetical protein
MGMQQVADISLRASIKELNFGDDTLSELVKMQTQEIDKIRMEYKGLKEENRRLKAICNLNELDYKEYLIKEEWDEELPEKNKLIEISEQERNVLVEQSKQVEKITIDKYADKKQKEKEEEYKNRIKEEMNKIN